MILRKRAPVRIAIESFQGYLRKEIDIERLEQGISKAASLLENDIPKEIRDVIERANNRMDTIRFATPEHKEVDEVGKIWRELQEVIARHDSPSDENGDE